MGPDREVVAGRHGHSVREQIGGADDEDHAQREPAARDAGDHRERRDDAVVRAIDQLADVVAGDVQRPGRFDVPRAPHVTTGHRYTGSR